MSLKESVSERSSKLSKAKQALLERRLNISQKSATEALVIPRRPLQNSFPLSFAQERLLFLAQLEPDSPAYNRPLALHITGALSVAILKQALSEILRRHEVLRATFMYENGQSVQRIKPPTALNLQLVDLGKLPPNERENEAIRLAAREAKVLFDLAKGPILRAILFRLDNKKHILLLIIHHIAFDGWSAKILIKELALLYEAFSMGNSSPLPKLPIQYADFAHWQRQELPGEILRTQLSFWEKRLSNAPPPLHLPSDHPRLTNEMHQGARQSLTLPVFLVASLKALSRQENVTLFMTLLAAFQTLLYRYTGQEDIVVGSPIAGRTRVETEGMIGFFVNNLVLRTDLSGNPTFLDLLARTRKVTLGAYAHQDLPFEKLVEELQPDRSLSSTPLFQVMFNLENIPHKEIGTHRLGIRELEFDSGIVSYDLNLEIVFNQDGTLTCLFKYNSHLFDGASIKRIAGHYQTLLKGIITNPEEPIGTLPLLTAAERSQLLAQWNDTRADYPSDMCIHRLFESQVARTPEAVAVVFEDKQLTYQELNSRANQLAHYLRTLDVGPEVLVGVYLERSLELIVGLLGILKAGGAYVPLDPTYPKERLDFLLEDAQVSILLVQERLDGGFSRPGMNLVCLDGDWQFIAKESEENLANETKAQNLVYVAYTSGSTGRPKGVMITHWALLNRLLWTQTAFRLTKNDRILRKAPPNTGNATWEFFLPLCVGGQAIIARPNGQQDSSYLVKLIAEQKVTVAHFVPSMLQVLLEERGLDQCSQLRFILSDGETLSVQLKERFFTRLNADLYNLYGQTETCIDVAYWTCKREDDTQTIPIGRPYANTQIYILDSHLQPVPIGVPGELHVGGAGLARGYLNRPELTTEKFIPNPFDIELGTRLFKTGDLARYLPDGNIEFLGRTDNQVKIRGFRIELGEIEAILTQYPNVQESVVLEREDEPDKKRLVAYIVSACKPTPSIVELRNFLKKRLPDYMIPSAFISLEKLPLASNGKVDRHSLPAPNQTCLELEETLVAPRSEVEQIIANIWCNILGLEHVGIHNNFFDIGGHSLLATQVLSRLRDDFRIELPIRTLFEMPTVADLAAEIETILSN